jgi:integrase
MAAKVEEETAKKSRKPKSASGQGGYYWHEKKELWEYRVTMGGRRCSLWGKTQTACRKKHGAAAERSRKGMKPLPDRVSVAGYLARWLEDVAKPNVRASVYARYEINCRVHLIPALGPKQLAKLGPEDPQRLYSVKLGSGLAPRTVRQMHTVLHNALQVALQWGLVPRNAADAVKAPRASKPEYRTVSADQAVGLLEAARNTPLDCLITLALTTGMREAELLGLRWADVHIDAGSLRVRQQAQRIPHEGWQYPEPKSQTSRRTVVLTPIGIEALGRQRERVHMMKALAGERWDDLDLVHPNRLGRPIERGNLLRRWKQFLTDHDYPEMTIHELRHSTATLLHALGIDLAVIQEILGHSSISITSDIYRGRVSDLHIDAMRRLSEALSGRNGHAEKPVGVPIGVPQTPSMSEQMKRHKMRGLELIQTPHFVPKERAR